VGRRGVRGGRAPAGTGRGGAGPAGQCSPARQIKPSLNDTTAQSLYGFGGDFAEEPVTQGVEPVTQALSRPLGVLPDPQSRCQPEDLRQARFGSRLSDDGFPRAVELDIPEGVAELEDEYREKAESAAAQIEHSAVV
jgi:hypothetical protein